MTEKVEHLIKTLGITEKEAEELALYDEQVDKGIIKDTLTTEQKKAVKKMTNVSRAVNAYGKEVKKEIKADDTKRTLIAYLAEMLEKCDNITSVEITNPQKLIAFKIGVEDFEIDLKRKRKK